MTQQRARTRFRGLTPALALICIAPPLAACRTAPVRRTVIRTQLEMMGSESMTKEGVTLGAKVYGPSDLSRISRFNRRLGFTSIDALKREAGSGHVTWTLVSPPAFEVKVTNRTGHVLRMTGTVVKLVDSRGQTYDVVTKEAATADLERMLVDFQERQPDGTSRRLGERDERRLASAMDEIPWLTENAHVLPDMTESFLLSFKLPIEGKDEMRAYQRWLSRQTSLTLKFYDVAAEVDEAGRPVKRVHFDIPVRIRAYKETWEDQRLIRRRPVRSS